MPSHPRTALSVALPIVALLAGALWLASSSAAHAQPVPADPTTRARELYQQGRQLADAGRWEEARTAFEQALALHEAPILHFALGTAQAETGRLVAARTSLRRFLATAADPTARSQIPAAEAALRALTPRIAHLVLHIEGGTARAARLDGTAVDLAALAAGHDVDPGAHHLEVEPAAGGDAVTRDVRLAEGAREEVSIRLPEPLLVGTAGGATGRGDDRRAGGGDDDRGGGVLSQWWFWTAVGVVVVGATVGVVVATQSGGRDPFAGDAPGGAIETLRFRGP